MSSQKSMLVVSVILPIHNGASYLQGCLVSLEAQTIDSNRFELIIVDDGSTDDTPRIVGEFAQGHPWARVIRQTQQGLYAARNAGIDAATGKYLFHLDVFDELTPNTLQSIVGFFDQHFDEVDLVTYRLLPHQNGMPKIPHYRYDTLNSDGVYDLTKRENWFLSQNTLNVCVKNRFENNVRFETPGDDLLAVHEDLRYITGILLEKQRLGFVNCCECRRMKDIVGSEALALRPYYAFDRTMDIFEGFFGRYEGAVPGYLQGCLVDLLAANMWASATLPTHLEGDAYEQALDRMGALLDMVGDDVLVTYPRYNPYHTMCLAKLKHGDPVAGKVAPCGTVVARGESVLYAAASIEICIERTRIHDNVLDIFGVVKNPIFLYSDHELTLYARHESDAGVQLTKVELLDSAQSYNGTDTITAKFFAFRYHLPLDKPCALAFVTQVDDRTFRSHFTTYPEHVNFTPQLGNEVVVNDMIVRMQPGDAHFFVEPAPAGRVREHQKLLMRNLDKRILIARTSMKAYELTLRRNHKGIWLYTDARGRLDNAWLQFKHDAPMDDGIMRMYVANDVDTSDFEETAHAKVIGFGSRVHKMVHFVADKRISSDIAWSCTSCWDQASTQNYADMNNAEKIYLQHGVLWAHLPWYYGFDRVLFDRQVVSTQFEIDNLTRNYGFLREDLIESGMPRFSGMDPHAQPQKKILFCPSWRSYLIGDLTPEGREPFDERFLGSAYYQGINKLLNDPTLAILLEKFDYTLDFKLHPNFACYGRHFKPSSPRIHIADARVNEADYAVVITDYSSYCFDFVYLNRALVFYIPDEDLFKAKLSNYSEVDLPDDKRFGVVVNTTGDALAAIEAILANDGKPTASYAANEQGFFLHYDSNQMDRLYEALMA